MQFLQPASCSMLAGPAAFPQAGAPAVSAASPASWGNTCLCAGDLCPSHLPLVWLQTVLATLQSRCFAALCPASWPRPFFHRFRINIHIHTSLTDRLAACLLSAVFRVYQTCFSIVVGEPTLIDTLLSYCKETPSTQT